MRMRPGAVAVAVAMAVLVSACGAPDGLPGSPPALAELLELMPAEAVSRGLFYSDRTDGEGFGSVLPLAGSSTEPFGFSLADVTQILETGGPPLTLLRGRFDARAVEGGFVAHGYERREADGWVVFILSGTPPAGDTPAPLAVAVPGAALRGGTLVLGDAGEVARVVQEGDGAADLEWPLTLARSVGGAADAVAIAPPPDLSDQARRLGLAPELLLEQALVSGSLPGYEGYAISHAADQAAGVLALAFPEGAGGTEVAADVIRRLATSSIVGEPTRRLANDVEPDGPRWFEEPRLVRMALQWRTFDASQVRTDVDQDRYAFLVPT